MTRDNHGLVSAALERTRFAALWPENAKTELAAQAELRSYNDGERAICSGDRADSVWLVVDGAFLLSKTWQNGRRLIYSYLRSGQSAGLLTVFDGLPADCDMTARGPGSALVIPGQALRAISRLYSDVSLQIVAQLCRHARADFERIELHAMNSVRSRIAKTILWLACGQTSAAGGDIILDSKFSQEDLADIVCAARQSVNRELRDLIRDGILRQGYRSLVILDPKRLAEVAAEDEELAPISFARGVSARDVVPAE